MFKVKIKGHIRKQKYEHEMSYNKYQDSFDKIAFKML